MSVGARSSPTWGCCDARVLQERGTAHEHAYLVHREAQGVAIPHPREIDDAESALAETRAAMESGANHINEVCYAA